MAPLRRVALLPFVPVACLGLLAAMTTLAGCANTQGGSLAAAVGGPTALEVDGLPMQVHPTSAIRQFPDDPAEPFSTNYGGEPPLLSGRAASRLSPAAEDAIIAAAITAHEMRRP
jgi:hypothetical protein